MPIDIDAENQLTLNEKRPLTHEHRCQPVFAFCGIVPGHVAVSCSNIPAGEVRKKVRFVI